MNAAKTFAAVAAAAFVAVASAAHPATEWAKEEYARFTKKVFAETPPAEFLLPGETADFADDFRALKDTDGYAVRTRGGKICFVADNPKGFVNGVHRWLERNSDIIWPRPAKELCFFTPRALHSGGVLSRLECDYRDIPAFRQRYFGFATTDEENLRWRARNALCTLISSDVMLRPEALKARLLETKRQCGVYGAFDDYYGFGHDMERLWLPRAVYLKEHPEWYLLFDGKRGGGSSCHFCETNPELPAAFADAVLGKAAELPPSVRTLLVCIEDSQVTCQCDNCLKPLELPGGEVVTPDDPAFRSTRFFLFFNKFARMVAAKRPELTIRQFAYLHLAIPPKVKIEPNVELMFCPFPRNLKESIATGESTAPWRKRTEEWLRVTDRLFLYEYYFDGGIFPRPIADLAVEDFRYFSARGASRVSWEAPDRFGDRKDVRLRGSRLPSSWFFDMSAMEAWTVGKLAWNPSLDPARLRREYLRRTFGPAAGAVGEFYALVHAAWKADKTPSRYDDNVFETAARYIVSKGIAGKCSAALEQASRLADAPGRREWIAAMREVFSKWVSEASNHVDAEFEISSSPAEFPELRLSGTRFCYALKDATVSIRAEGRAFEVSARILSQYIEGEGVDISFASPGGEVRTFALSEVRRNASGWEASARIDFSRLGFDPETAGGWRCLPRVWLKEGAKASALDFTWLGGRIGNVDKWGRARLVTGIPVPSGEKSDERK